MDQIVAYFKENPILGIILLALTVVLIALIVTAIVYATKKRTNQETAIISSDNNQSESTPSTNTVQQTFAEDSPPASSEQYSDIRKTMPQPETEINNVMPPYDKPEQEPVKTSLSKQTIEGRKNKTENPATPPAKPSATKSSVNNKAYAGKWIITENRNNKDSLPTYSFELRASNGEKLLASTAYKSLQGAKNGIKTYRNNIVNGKFTIAQNKKGDYFFKLLNASDRLLCTGEQYQSKFNCESAIDSVKRFAETAVIVVEENED